MPRALYRSDNPSPIVRDMQNTAHELGIAATLLDCWVFLRDGDIGPAQEVLADALLALGVDKARIEAHSSNNRPAVSSRVERT